MNTYAYVYNNPMNLIDPYGLWALGDPLPQGLVDFSAGFGDTLSFGLTDWVRDQMGTNGVVDKCSGAYSGGEWAGIGWGLAFGGAGLARGGFRAELGNWKQGGEWFFREGTRGPHFHFGRGPGLQKHHLPWQSGNWWRNFQNLVRQGKAGDDLGSIGAVGYGFGVAGNGIAEQGCGCEQ